MKNKMVTEIKTKYTGQPVSIDYLSTKIINHIHNVKIIENPDDSWERFITIDKNPNDSYHIHIGINRILKITTPDGKVWENPPEEQKYWCNNCGYKTTKPRQDYLCPKCLGQPQQYRRYVRLQKVGSHKFG